MRLRFPLLAALGMVLPGCGKSPVLPADSASTPADTSPAEVVPPLYAQAGRFGLAARLPTETPFYFGTVDLAKHISALKGTRYWKEVIAYAEDKAPTPSADLPSSIGDLAEFPLGEFALALAPGSEAAIGQIIQLQALYSELTYYGLMAGSSASLIGGSPKASDLVGDVFSMPGLMERIIALAADIQVPKLILGAKLTNHDEVLQSIRRFLEGSAELREARISTLTTPLGETLEIREWKLETWLTDEFVSSLSETIPEEHRATASTGLEQLRTILAEKTICLAYGQVADHVVLALSPHRGDIQFVTEPTDSLMARADLQKVADAVVAKDIAAISVWDDALLQNAIDRQPTKPMLDGALNGLRSSEVFAPMVDSVSPQVSAFAEAERAYHDRNYDDGAAVFWWENGLHAQTIGGASTRDWKLKAPLRFEPLLDTPGLVFGIDGHDGPSNKGRPYFESGMALIYAAAQQALSTGLAGGTFTQIGTVVDKEVIPQVIEAYDATKTLYTKALDTESAFLAELGGQMPMVWGMKEPPKGQPMLRLAAIHQVKNRTLLSQSWLRAESALGAALKKIPSPIPLAMSTPIQSERYGVTSYHQAPLFDSPDLLPCASVNDTLYILGTSKSLNEELAFQLKESADQPTQPGLRLRVRFENVRKLLATAGSFSSEEAAAATREAARLWMAPLGLLDAHVTEDESRVRTQIDWSIRDLQDYD